MFAMNVFVEFASTLLLALLATAIVFIFARRLPAARGDFATRPHVISPRAAREAGLTNVRLGNRHLLDCRSPLAD
jgi:hypothetical protein